MNARPRHLFAVPSAPPSTTPCPDLDPELIREAYERAHLAGQFLDSITASQCSKVAAFGPDDPISVTMLACAFEEHMSHDMLCEILAMAIRRLAAR